MVGPAVKREAVAHLQARDGPVGASGMFDRQRRPDDGPLLMDPAAGRAISPNERRRFGYRRLFILLRREGEPSPINRIHRLYREEGLSVRKRRTRHKAVGHAGADPGPMHAGAAPTDWSAFWDGTNGVLDFQDSLDRGITQCLPRIQSDLAAG
jgi:hypothetical protein